VEKESDGVGDGGKLQRNTVKGDGWQREMVMKRDNNLTKFL
jgi:hypothetical protein